MVFVIIRGDLDVNEVKLNNILKATDLRMATEPEVIEAGIVAGAASPVRLEGIKIIADDSVNSGTNFVAGGNKPDLHLKNVNYPRDFRADVVADIATARAGDSCAVCGGTLIATRGIELGHIFKLGTIYSEKFEATFIDENSKAHLVVMGCYGLGLGRAMAAIIEANHDDKGVTWPLSVAPYHVYICPLYREGTDVFREAEKLYDELTAAGLEVLIDDREESPGVKFNDADLLGIPFRVTVSQRTLEKNSVELKKRSEKNPEIVPLNRVGGKISSLIDEGMKR
jgi:prolyl-tRNA synthetase